MNHARTSSHMISSSAAQVAKSAALASVATLGVLLCLSSSTDRVSSWILGPKTRVDVSQLSWWTETRFAIEKLETLPAQVEAVEDFKVASNTTPEPTAPFRVKKKSVPTTHLGNRIRRDRLKVSQAKPSELPALPLQLDLLEMRRLHRQLRTRVTLALLEAPAPVVIQVTAQVKRVAPAKTLRKAEYSSSAPRKSVERKPAVPVANIAPTLIPANRALEVHPSFATPVTKVLESEKVFGQAALAPVTPSETVSGRPVLATDHLVSTQASGQIIVTAAGQTRTVMTGAPGSAPVQMSSQATEADEYPLVLPPAALGVNSHGPGGVSIQATAGTSSASSVSSHSIKDSLASPAYVEAFQWSEPIFNATANTVSSEGEPEGRQASWIQASADDHWPTLAQTQSASLGASIPLVSENNLRLLEQKYRIQVSSGAGVVFGRLSRDFEIRFSGRSEQKILLDEPGTDGLRSFILLNVEPGAHLLHFARGTQKGAVAVPVRSGVATYMDLSLIEKKTVKGRILDADSKAADGIPGIQVSAVGHSGVALSTDHSGAFLLNEISVPVGHGVYLESESSEGYKHRYSISPSLLGSELVLFRFRTQRIRALTGQLEGGVSPESGLIMGALPALAAQAKTENEGVFASVHPLESTSALIPETYSLDSEDRLLVNTPVNASAGRFVAVQVPSGPNLLVLEDQSQKIRWSELIIASPSVINVIAR